MFCGSCNVVSKIDSNRKRVASDNHAQLIALLKHTQLGFDLPSDMSEAQYARAKNNEYADWLTGFIGFGCSFAGKYFGGYARGDEKRNYALNAKRSLTKKMATMNDVEFLFGDYRDIDVDAGSLVYCDIPYLEKTGFTTGKFDHEAFYDWCKKQKERGNRVLVSEYKENVPIGATVVWQKKSNKEIRSAIGYRERTIEVLFEFK